MDQRTLERPNKMSDIIRPEDVPDELIDVPPERNPEVLNSALQMAALQVLRLAHTLRRDMDYVPSDENVKHYAKSCIDKAIRELESEAGK